MQTKNILIAVTLAAVLAAPGYAQQQQGNRYLVYMRGIT